MPIKVGDRVRSFDFARGGRGRDLQGDRACYVEGTVEAIVPRGTPVPESGAIFPDCDRYAIRVSRRVFGGEESQQDVGDLVFPPVNGSRSWLSSGPLEGVEPIDRPADAGA